MIKHKLIEQLEDKDQYIFAISYLKEGKIETTVFSNDFPVLDMPTVRNEFSGLLFELYEKEVNTPEDGLDSGSKIVNNQIKGLIE
tara:strand:- start:2812 stop:3066 length:255 start_codon:yes stop_codon:yes gene_type:complete